MIHKLKIEKNYLRRLLDESKKAEIRYNDRDYQVGDFLEFTDYEHEGVSRTFEITHIHSGLGLKESYVILSVIWRGGA